MVYTVEGEFRMGRSIQKFKKTVSAVNARAAEEKVYAELGSKHKVKRRFVKITKVSGKDA
jgi:large subunit ribosomal protein LX